MKKQKQSGFEYLSPKNIKAEQTQQNVLGCFLFYIFVFQKKKL